MLWISIAGYGLGFSIIAHAVLSGLVALYSARSRLFHRRRISLRDYDRDTTPDTGIKVSLDDLLGISSIPWIYIYVLVAAVALIAYALTHQILLLGLAVLPTLARIWLTRQRKRQLTSDMWTFLMDLRIRLPLRGTLLLALQDIAAAGHTSIAMAVKTYLDAGYRRSGVDLLCQLNADIPSLPFLTSVVGQLEAAQSGTLSMDNALRYVMTNIQSEMQTTSRQQLQEIPSRLIVISFPALLGPVLAVLIVPVVARMIASLQGMTWGSGF